MSEERDAYDRAQEVQKDYDCKRGELIAVALSIYSGHAASPDGANTVRSCLDTAAKLIDMVDQKVGERPKLMPFPEHAF